MTRCRSPRPNGRNGGNPITDPAAFRNILAYSPYENVRAQDYPALLVLAGLTDPRVTYWEPAKWVARLRATQTGRCVLAFRTNWTPATPGAAGRFRAPQGSGARLRVALAAVNRPERIAFPVSPNARPVRDAPAARRSTRQRIVPCGSSASIEPSV